MRADGSGSIGMGHIMRCIGLAHAFIDRNFEVVFLLGIDSPPVVNRLEHENLNFVCGSQGIASQLDSALTSAICIEKQATLLLIDGYRYDTEWLQSLEVGDTKIMLWTDYLQAEELPVSLVLDQTAGANYECYRKAAPTATLLCGLDYVVLRPEFIENKLIRRLRESATHLLVTMGGADPEGATLKALEAIKRLLALNSLSEDLQVDPISTRVVVGPANRFLREINELAAQIKSCEVYSSVTDMSEFLAWADLAIASAGTSVWEFSYAGLPAITISIADNQVPLAKAVQEFGGGVDLGMAEDLCIETVTETLRLLLVEPERIRSMSEKMLEKVDGLGAIRVIDAVEKMLE